MTDLDRFFENPDQFLVDPVPTPEQIARRQELIARWEEKGLLRRIVGPVTRVATFSRTEGIPPLRRELWDDIAREALGKDL